MRDLFAEGASYRMSPYEPAAVGLEEISSLWERERQGPGERFEMAHELVALDGGTAVLRVEVRYGGPEPLEYRDLWVVRFDAQGRCESFEEWPFWPGQPIAAKGGST